MAVHFECTRCGKCCRDPKLPLSVDEAIVWAERGHPIRMLVEGLPWTGPPAAGDAKAMHDRDRTFPAMCGDIPIRVGITLVAWHDDACPYLQPDNSCGNYAARPRVCRIYPMMARPFERLEPARRLCPAEAWAGDLPVLMLDDRPADPENRQVLDDHRRAMTEDVPSLNALCAVLGWSKAGFAHEGFAVLAPDADAMAEALHCARNLAGEIAAARQWTYITNRKSTLAMLHTAGCDAELVNSGADYLGSFSAEP